MNGFEPIGEHTFDAPRYFKCVTCGATVPSGIINLSGHWAECAGKGVMENVNKISNMPLSVKDKMDLIKKEFSIEQ